jgi:hypothetical protein
LGRGKTYEANMAILLVKLPQSEISFDETEGFFTQVQTELLSVISNVGIAVAEKSFASANTLHLISTLNS